MHLHALNQAIALYRGGTLTLEQAARHAGVSRARMEAALRSRSVSVRESLDSPTPEVPAGRAVVETGPPTPSADPFENSSAGAD